MTVRPNTWCRAATPPPCRQLENRDQRWYLPSESLSITRGTRVRIHLLQHRVLGEPWRWAAAVPHRASLETRARCILACRDNLRASGVWVLLNGVRRSSHRPGALSRHGVHWWSKGLDSGSTLPKSAQCVPSSRRAIPCSDWPRQRHDIIPNRLALTAKRAWSGVTGATAQVNQETPPMRIYIMAMTEYPVPRACGHREQGRSCCYLTESCTPPAQRQTACCAVERAPGCREADEGR